MPVQVHYRNDKETILADLENDAVGESMRQTSPGAIGKALPRSGIRGRTTNRPEDFVGEFIAKAWAFQIVVVDGVLKLKLSRFEDVDLHFSLIRSMT